MWVLSRDIEEKPYARFDGCRLYSFLSHYSTKCRSRSLDQCKCKVGTSRRSHMQGLMVVGFIVDEILRVGLKNDKVTGA